MYPNLHAGYDPYPQGRMLYSHWIKKQGLYRWKHEDGQTRTIYPIGEYSQIYNYVCKTADIAFAYREIPEDIDGFTSEFLAAVPMAWMKYKTQLELLAGTLDGTNIDPDIFEAGYDRQHRVTTNTTQQSDADSTSTGNATDTHGAVTGHDDTTATITNYEQGVQPYGEDEEFQRDYASAAAKNKSNNINTRDEYTDNSDTTGQSQTHAEGAENVIMDETDHMTRINYYDNLAFLRERFDRLGKLQNFHDYFEPLFSIVHTFDAWYN